MTSHTHSYTSCTHLLCDLVEHARADGGGVRAHQVLLRLRDLPVIAVPATHAYVQLYQYRTRRCTSTCTSTSHTSIMTNCTYSGLQCLLNKSWELSDYKNCTLININVDTYSYMYVYMYEYMLQWIKTLACTSELSFLPGRNLFLPCHWQKLKRN